MVQLDGKRGGSNEMEKYSLCCRGWFWGLLCVYVCVLYCFMNKIAQA